MTREEALELLATKSTYQRLTAARTLARAALPSDRKTIASALKIEGVVWIRNALQQALRALDGEDGAQPIAIGPLDIQEAGSDEYARGALATTKSILHEINPLVGLIRLYAEKEIPDFAASRTKAHLERLARVARAFDGLAQAGDTPTMEVFNIGECIALAAEALTPSDKSLLTYDGESDVMVRGSMALVDIIVTNAMRNAIEAEEATDNARPVVVNWGRTNSEAWFAVLDRGIGLPPRANRAFDIGTTSKEDHTGMGLAIAKVAARSMGGMIRLSPRDGGGVAFECRWPDARDS